MPGQVASQVICDTPEKGTAISRAPPTLSKTSSGFLPCQCLRLAGSWITDILDIAFKLETEGYSEK